jgi:hypothetical protein
LNFSITRRCDCDIFEGHEEFLDEVRRKGDKLGRRMMYERKQQMREKHLNVPPGWIIRTIKRELNLCEHTRTLDDLHDEHDKALAYWRQNRQQYPPARLWDIFYYDLLCKSFKSRYELRDWCRARLQQLNNPVYCEEQRCKTEEEKRLAQEAEQKRMPKIPATWKHYKARCEEVDRCAREVDAGSTTSKTWPPPRSPPDNFPFVIFAKACNSL